MTKLLLINGQFGLPLLQSGLAPVLAKYENVQVTSTSWDGGIPALLYDVIVAHSLAVETAINHCNYVGPNSQPKLLLTIDGRHQSNAGWLGVIPIIGMLENLGDFKAPNAVCHNFYQRGIWMHGCAIDGAENTLLPWQTHLTICGAQAVRDRLDQFLAGAK